MTRPTTAPQTYGDLLWHPRLSYRKVSKALYDGDELTALEISTMTGVTPTSVRNSLAYFKQLGFVHVCRWEMPEDKPNSVFAVYKIGKGFNVPKPGPRYLKNYTPKRDRVQERKDAEAAASQMWKDRMAHFVPKRTPQEQYEVNRLYLNWIGGGVYG